MMPKEIDLPLFHPLNTIVLISLLLSVYFRHFFFFFLTKWLSKTHALLCYFFNDISYFFHIDIVFIYLTLLEQCTFHSATYNLLNHSIVRHLVIFNFNIIHNVVSLYFCTKNMSFYLFLKLFLRLSSQGRNLLEQMVHTFFCLFVLWLLRQSTKLHCKSCLSGMWLHQFPCSLP